MQKYIYVPQVMGFSGIYSSLFENNKELHYSFMEKLFELNLLENISDIFTSEADLKFVKNNCGFLVINNNTFTFYRDSINLNKFRTNTAAHQIIEHYNMQIKPSYQLEYKEISEERIPFVQLIENDDGSEQIFFTN